MEKYYKLSEYAKRGSVTYKTAWTHFKQRLIDWEFKYLMKDLISVIYSFSARMYGLRRRKNRQEIIDFIEK